MAELRMIVGGVRMSISGEPKSLDAVATQWEGFSERTGIVVEFPDVASVDATDTDNAEPCLFDVPIQTQGAGHGD